MPEFLIIHKMFLLNYPKNPIVAVLGDFGYSQNGGGTFSDFLIFFSPWLYLLITTSSSLKAAD